MAPLPQYIMPDESEPEYELILEQLQDYRKSLIGSSYYYIRAVMTAATCAGLFMVAARYFSMNWWITINMGSVMKILKMSVKNDIRIISPCRDFILFHPHIEQKAYVILYRYYKFIFSYLTDESFDK